MKLTTLIAFLLLPVLLNTLAAQNVMHDEHPSLSIGNAAPDFSLPGVDGKTYSLASFKTAKILVIVFTCNHCPTAQAYEDRLIKLAKDYASKGVAVVAINPNTPGSITLDELGYTDMSDTYGEMKIREKKKKFNFPYLYDGKTEITSRAYGPVATPHVFIFDQKRKLRYSGRIDDVEKPTKTPTKFDTKNAIEALLAGNPVPVETTKVFGCSIKWAEKNEYVAKLKKEWAEEPVTLDSITIEGIKDLLKNNSGKLRLINVWATWCGPCVSEFSDFIIINRMYRRRDFEFVSISADDPGRFSKALQFLKSEQASSTNYIFGSEDKYQLMDAIDPKWPGALPYTIIVEPGGKIVYSKQGPVDAKLLKKLIVDNPLIGRYY